MEKTSTHNDIQANQESPKSITASKKVGKHIIYDPFAIIFIYERLWQSIFLLMTIASAVLFKKIYEYQTLSCFDNVRKGQFWNLIVYGIPFAILYTIFDFLVHYVFDGITDKYYINHNMYTDPQVRKNRCYTLVKWGYSIIYYSLSSRAAYLLLKNTSYLPSFLGGSGDAKNLFNNFPQNGQLTFDIEFFYILQFGKHLSRTFCHLFIRSEGNYYEFALHHGLSIFLITFSYTMDQWLIGTFVLLIHDVTDLTLIFARAYRDFKSRNQTVLKCAYVLAIAPWIVCRIFVFGYVLIYCTIWSIVNVLIPQMDEKLDPNFKQTMLIPFVFMSAMLIVLQILQFFWTYYIVKSVTVNISAKLAYD